MPTRNKLVVAGLGVAALSLVGIGAGATFTDAVHATQTITAGTLSLNVQSVGNDGAVSGDGHSITLNSLSPVASSFDSGAQAIKIVNVGNITAHTFSIGLTQNNNDSNLLSEIDMKVTSYDPTASTPGNTTDQLFNGPINTWQDLQVTGDLTPQGTQTNYDQIEVEFYTPQGTSLQNSDEGHSVVPTLTITYQG